MVAFTFRIHILNPIEDLQCNVRLFRSMYPLIPIDGRAMGGDFGREMDEVGVLCSFF